MVTKNTFFMPSRRQFLLNVLPAGTLFCLGCGNLIALAQSEKNPQVSPSKHKFLEDSGMSFEAVYKFAFQHYFIPVMKNLSDDTGKGKFMEILKKASSQAGAQNMKRLTQNLRKRDLAVWAAFMKGSSLYKKVLTFEIVEESDKALEVRITECLWAKTFREADASEIGYAAICYPDFAAASAFNPKIKMIRTKTLMQGHDCCNHRYVMEG
jgi:hypothetical protein